MRSDTTIDSPSRGDVKPVDMVATRDPEDGSTTIFAVNRSVSDAALLDVRIVHDDTYTIVEHAVIGGAHLQRRKRAQSDPARVYAAAEHSP